MPTDPSCAEVLGARVGRVAMARGFLATVTQAELAVPRTNPWSPAHPETTLSRLHVILEEEWEHHRFTVRDLAAIGPEHTAPTSVAAGHPVDRSHRPRAQ